MATVLARFGFPPGNIHKLVDAAATRQAILSGLDHLLHVAGEDGVLFVHFSGWGLRVPRGPSTPGKTITPWLSRTRDAYSTMKSRSLPGKYPGDRTAPSDEPLGDLVSALVPHDWDPDSVPAITYDELRDWVARAAGHNLVLVLDAPYAGKLVEGPTAIAGGHVFMAASRSDEICLEFQTAPGVYQGAFTYHLAQALLEAEPGATYRDIFFRVNTQLAARFPGQHPQFGGDANAPVFTAGQPASSRLITVKSRARERVVLGAGAAHGATVRSLWAIYAAGGPDITSRTPKLGLVEITGVQTTQAEAQILSESGYEVIQPGAIAVEEAHFFGDMRLAVRVEAPQDYAAQRDGLMRLLTGTELIELIDVDAASETADVTVHLLPPRAAATEDDPVPQLDELTEPTWAAVDRTSDLIMGPITAMSSAAVYEIRDRLESYARARNVVGLRNPNLNSLLAGKVHLEIMRLLPDGQWGRAEAERSDGMPVFQVGDRIALDITNDHSEPVYVGVFDFSLTSNVSMLYPAQGPTEQIGPGQSVQVGMRPGEELVLYLPDDFRGRRGADDPIAASGIETLKLFATVYPTDLGNLLLQEGGRGLIKSRGESTALWQLLDLALTGVGARELRPVQLPPDQEWTTLERAYVLQSGG
jgi:hypothetical protein